MTSVVLPTHKLPSLLALENAGNFLFSSCVRANKSQC